MRTCVLCGDNCQGTTCDRCRAQDPRAPNPLDQAKEDARMFGVGFVVDGKRVSPQSVVVVREPAGARVNADPNRPLADGAIDHAALMLARANESAFENFWLREGPSLAWDEDRKRAARRIWDAARKGCA